MQPSLAILACKLIAVILGVRGLAHYTDNLIYALGRHFALPDPGEWYYTHGIDLLMLVTPVPFALIHLGAAIWLWRVPRSISALNFDSNSEQILRAGIILIGLYFLVTALPALTSLLYLATTDIDILDNVGLSIGTAIQISLAALMTFHSEWLVQKLKWR